MHTSDRKSVAARCNFFSYAQRQWHDKYSKDNKARDNVIAKNVGVQRNNASKKPDRTRYFWQHDEPEPKRSHSHGDGSSMNKLVLIVECVL